MGQARVRKSSGTYFGQPGYVAPRTKHHTQADDFAFPCPCESKRMFKDCCGRLLIMEDGSPHPIPATKFVYSASDLQSISFDSQFLPAQWAQSCDACGGVCEWVNVPNKVWTALGLDKEFLCVKCMSRLIDPALNGTVDNLAKAILSRKRKFDLDKTNKVFELSLSDDYAVVQMFSVDLPPLTRDQFFDFSLTPGKESVVHAVPRVHTEGIFPFPRLQRRQVVDAALGWPLYVCTTSDRVWYIEPQIKNQFDRYCNKEKLQIELIESIEEHQERLWEAACGKRPAAAEVATA